MIQHLNKNPTILFVGDAPEPACLRGDWLRHGGQLPALLVTRGAVRRVHDQLLPPLQLKPGSPRPLLPLKLVQDEAEQGGIPEVP